MKKIGLFILTALIAGSLLPSCNDSDADYPNYKALVTVRTDGEASYYFDFDNEQTAFPGDTRRIGYYKAEEGQRAMILFNYLDAKAEGYDNNISLYAIMDILTKDPKIVTTREELDAVGNDPLDIVGAEYGTPQIWIGGGHLNINFALMGSPDSKHEMILLQDKTPEAVPETDGYTNVEFRQKATGLIGHNYQSGWVSYRLGDLDPALSGSKGLNVRVKTLSGAVKYYKVDVQNDEK